MKHLLVLFVCSLGLTAAANAATTEAELIAPIQRFVDAFNQGDMAAAEATHVATGVVIIDEPAPHLWQGPGAFKAWINDLSAHDKAHGWTEQHMKFGKVIRAESTGDRGYVVLQPSYAFKQNGVAMNEDPTFWTFALQKTDAGWRINGWSWGGSPPHKAN